MSQFEQGDDRCEQPFDLQSPSHASQDPRCTPHSLSPNELSFEKNYPKNIFIPIIEYLAEIGLKKMCEEEVGTREHLEGKNVVSLGLIHQLITQPWFQKTVDKEALLSTLSNKIMINSKIKKKLFHLKVAQIIINAPLLDQKQFKKSISRSSNWVAIECGRTEDTLFKDQLFKAPNSIIYLLRIVLKTLRHKDLQLQNTHQGSKEQYKHLVKEITSLLNKKISPSELTDLYLEIKNQINFLQQATQQQFNLPQNVPNWDLFITSVIDRFFQHKRLEVRVTNSAINQWVNEYKIKVTSAREIIDPGKWFGARIFQPIIIMPPTLN